MTTCSRGVVAAPTMLRGRHDVPAAGRLHGQLRRDRLELCELLGIEAQLTRLATPGAGSASGSGFFDLLARLSRCEPAAPFDALFDRGQRELLDPVRLVEELLLDVRAGPSAPRSARATCGRGSAA